MGALLIVLSSLAFSFSTFFGKLGISNTLMTGAINSFSRFVLGTILSFLFIVWNKKTLRPKNLKPIVFRAFFNSIAILFLSMSFKYTTVTNGNMLHMIYPVFVILLSPLITGESIRKDSYIYLILVIIGSIIVTKPTFSGINLGDFFALASAVFASFSVMYLTNASRDNDGYIIVFYVMLFGLLFNLPFAIKDIMNFTTKNLPYIALAASTGFMGQILITIGYRYVESSTGALISSSRIIFGAIIGIIFLKEPIDLRIGMGIVLITAALIGSSGFFNRKQIESK